EPENRLAGAAARHHVVAAAARHRRRRSVPIDLRCQRSCLARPQVGPCQAVLPARDLPGGGLYRRAGQSEMGIRANTRIPPGMAARGIYPRRTDLLAVALAERGTDAGSEFLAAHPR